MSSMATFTMLYMAQLVQMKQLVQHTRTQSTRWDLIYTQTQISTALCELNSNGVQKVSARDFNPQSLTLLTTPNQLTKPNVEPKTTV